MDPTAKNRFRHRYREGWPPYHWFWVWISRFLDRIEGHTWLHEFHPLPLVENDDYCIHCLKSCPYHLPSGKLLEN